MQKFCDTLAKMRFLRALQDNAGLNPNQAALRLGVPPQTYHYWLKNADSIKFEYLVRIKQAFGLTWAQLGKLIETEIAENQRVAISNNARKPPKSAPGKAKA